MIQERMCNEKQKQHLIIPPAWCQKHGGMCVFPFFFVLVSSLVSLLIIGTDYLVLSFAYHYCLLQCKMQHNTNSVCKCGKT